MLTLCTLSPNLVSKHILGELLLNLMHWDSSETDIVLRRTLAMFPLYVPVNEEPKLSLTLIHALCTFHLNEFH